MKQKPSRVGSRDRKKRPRARNSTNVDVRVDIARDYPWLLLGHLNSDLSGWLTDSDRDLVSGIVRSRDFARYSELSERWGLQSINSSVEPVGPEMASKLLIGSVIRKYPFEGREKEKRDIAIAQVIETNRTCSVFNRTGWKRLYIDGYPTKELSLMREFIRKVIGFSPPLEEGHMTVWSRHGPGADTATLLGNCSSYDKYVEWPYRVTAGCLEHARSLILSDERWLGALEDSYRRKFHIEPWEILDWTAFWSNVFSVTEHNRVTTVPKDGSKDRPIAIEPRMNLMLQLGVDGFIRRRLKRFGLNLDSQKPNQLMAYQGSIRSDADTPVTIDLSNASDTISLRLVKLLFPEDWYRYLCELRCPCGTIPGRGRLRYSKLSSMGNGYTFAVETLTFCAICYAALHVSGLRWDPSYVAVFGDDMVVPQSAGAPLLNLLQMCGLTPNLSKSFLAGRVRESCGTDWVSGTNMRPIFIKDRPETVCELFTHRNQIVRWFDIHLQSMPDKVEAFYGRLIPEPLKLFGPLSDEEFNTYLHSKVPSGWASDAIVTDRSLWSYHYEYLACNSRLRAGREFLFRKLMHNLRPAGGTEEPWLKPGRKFKVSTGGSRFAITNRGRVTYSKCVRVTPNWSREYSDAYGLLISGLNAPVELS